MKVLVTGAGGGMGGMVIGELLKAGAEVVATSRDIEKIRNSDFFSSIDFVPYDINSRTDDDLFVLFGKPDTIIHLAWDRLDNYNLPEHTGIFLENHKYFVSNLLRNGLSDFNGIGTCYECGLQEGLLKEEECSQVPTQPYSLAKSLLRKYCEGECLKYGAAFKWIRFFYVFGESPAKSRKNLYALLNEAMRNGDKVFNMSGGEQIRDFSTPDEMARRVVMIATQDKVTGIINCASGKPVKLKEFVQEYLDNHKSQIKLNLGHYPYADYEPMTTWADTTKLQAILNNNDV